MNRRTRWVGYSLYMVVLVGVFGLLFASPVSASIPQPSDVFLDVGPELRLDDVIRAPLADPNLQVVHLAPFADDINDTAVNISINGTPVLTDVLYAGSTGYLSVGAGENQIQIFPSGSSTPAISETVVLTADMDFTAIAIGGANGWDLGLKLLEDDNSAPTAGKAKVRIGHLAPFAAGSANTLADVRLQDGTILPGFDDVPYDVVADYIELDAGEYDLKITSADGSTTLIDPVPVTFAEGDIVSVLAVGDGMNQPVGVFALPSGMPGGLVDLVSGYKIYLPLIVQH